MTFVRMREKSSRLNSSVRVRNVRSLASTKRFDLWPGNDGNRNRCVVLEVLRELSMHGFWSSSTHKILSELSPASWPGLRWVGGGTERHGGQGKRGPGKEGTWFIHLRSMASQSGGFVQIIIMFTNSSDWSSFPLYPRDKIVKLRLLGCLVPPCKKFLVANQVKYLIQCFRKRLGFFNFSPYFLSSSCLTKLPEFVPKYVHMKECQQHVMTNGGS